MYRIPHDYESGHTGNREVNSFLIIQLVQIVRMTAAKDHLLLEPSESRQLPSVDDQLFQ